MKISTFLLINHCIGGWGLIWPVGLFILPWIELASLSQTGDLLRWNGPATGNFLDGHEDARIL